MDRSKREFIAQCAAIVGGGAVTQALGGETVRAQEPLTNWAGNLTYGTTKLQRARAIAEMQALVKAHDRIKVQGTRHCFNGIADSRDVLLSIRDMTQILRLDEKTRQVTVEAGASYGQLCPELDRRGYALHNLASLPHISIAGACATATHGSGLSNGNLATAVAALEMVTASGDVLKLSRGADSMFDGAVVNLGALGVVTHVTLDVQPAFAMRQDVYLNQPMAQARDHFDDIVSAGYSVSLFTDWRNSNVNEVWIKRRIDGTAPPATASEFYGAKAATVHVHPIIEISAEHCTEQLGVPGRWYERLPHFKMGFTPSSGKELQSEYFVPRRNAVEAINAVERLHEHVSPHLMITELRTIDADTLWMSPCYKQPSLAIHFTWKQDWDAVSKVLPMIERELAPFGVKPHWGKLFTIDPATLRKRYERFDDFKALVAKLDPKGKFRNEFLADILGS